MNIKLKQHREQKSLTQRQLAQKTQLTERGYQRYEYGENIPNVEIAIRIARALHTTVEDIWGRE